MTNETNGPTAPENVLGEITRRLATIAPDEFAKPDGKIEKTDHVVGTIMDDDLKRLYTLFILTHEDTRKAVARGKTILSEILGKRIPNNPIEVLTILSKDQEGVHLLEKSQDEFLRLDRFSDLVKDLFWLQVRRRFPDLMSKPSIGIRENWVICWTEDASPHIEILDLNAMSPGFAELFGQRVH